MKYIHLILFWFISLNLFAQNLRYIPNQPLVEKAIEKGFFLSKQSYQIYDKKSGDIFGLNGKSEFGVQYTIGIKTLGGFLLVDKAMRPWLYDNNFEKYKGKYDPIFYQALYSESKEKVAYDTLEYTLTQQEMLVDTTLYYFPSRTFGGEGFALDDIAGEKDGWIVWITSSREADFEKEVDLHYTIYKKTLTLKQEREVFQIEQPSVEQKILGGIYVVPSYTKIGVLEFKLCGILVPVDDKWFIHCPFVESTHKRNPSVEDSEKESEQSVELTPIGKAKEEKVKEGKTKKK